MLKPPRTLSLLVSETPTSAPAPSVESRMPTPIRPASSLLARGAGCGSGAALEARFSAGADTKSDFAVSLATLAAPSSAAARLTTGRRSTRPATNSAFLSLSIFCNGYLLWGFQLGAIASRRYAAARERQDAQPPGGGPEAIPAKMRNRAGSGGFSDVSRSIRKRKDGVSTVLDLMCVIRNEERKEAYPRIRLISCLWIGAQDRPFRDSRKGTFRLRGELECQAG